MFDTGKLALARIATETWMVIALALIEPADTLSLLAPVRVGTIVASDKVGLLDIVDAINLAWGWKRRPPTIPYRLALGAAAPFALVDPLGSRFGIHPRRIQKLHLDTNVSASRLADIGFTPQYSLSEAFSDWRRECGGGLPS